MGFNALKFFTNDEYDESYEGYSTPRLVKAEHLNIVVRTPRSFSDVREYADALMSNSAVMVNFDSVDAATKNRIFDYLNGVAYIVDASVEAISDDMLLYAPANVEVNKAVAMKQSRTWLG